MLGNNIRATRWSVEPFQDSPVPGLRLYFFCLAEKGSFWTTSPLKLSSEIDAPERSEDQAVSGSLIESTTKKLTKLAVLLLDNQSSLLISAYISL